MCGIVGYVGRREVLPILIQGLKALEYRGYDSAGVALVSEGEIACVKEAGAVAELEKRIKKEGAPEGISGIAHTRWATHGAPTRQNAHPHTDCAHKIAIVHNGIIENYKEIKEMLLEKGHKFASETDTEVLAHLIEENVKSGKSFRDAFYASLNAVRGAYALVVADADHPGTLYATRISSPLVIGVGEDEHIVASDPSALVDITKNVIYLKDGDVAEITQGRLTITDLAQKPQFSQVTRLEWTTEQAQKGDFPHFMLKEIFEGPEVVRSALRGRLKSEEGFVKLGGLDDMRTRLSDTKRILILACGTSYYAGLVGEYLFETIAGIPTEVQLASEFRYREEPLEQGTTVIAISQSGETADTLAALRKAKQRELLTLGVVNVVGSTIARDTDAGVYNHAGPEIGVASTKAFLSQLSVLTLMALYLTDTKDEEHKALMREMGNIDEKIKKILAQQDEIEALAEKYSACQNMLYLGRGFNYPVALEGALKIKEIAYVHAEGYSAGEMKHGPIALITKDFPTVAIATDNAVFEKMASSIEEIKARGGPVIVIGTEGDERVKGLGDDLILIPKTLPALEPLLSVVPLQLFAYFVGVKRGYNVDKPRNLAKSVTVE
ncbi:MAG: glutamine--fructose-6-phosphate transaminase (isomerizing) [Patescibacteria group bacterium]